MIKTLLKKQLLELNAFYFMDKKTGKRRSPGKTAAFIVLFVVLFAYLGFMFGGMAFMMVRPLTEAGLGWLYFAIMGIIALLFGIIGSAFNTYAGLYHAKDNDLLLSMPIPPRAILFVRVCGVGVMGALYTSLVYLPTLIIRLFFAPVSVTGAVFAILLYPVLLVLVTALSCVLGFVIAFLSSKFKNKSILTVLFALAAFAVYYYICFNAFSAIEDFIAAPEGVAATVKTALWPFWQMGRAAEGEWLPMVGFTAAVAVLFAAVYALLSRTFIGIVTKKTAVRHITYKEKQVRATGATGALFRREWKRFLASTTYMLNAGLGCVFSVVLAVVFLFLDVSPALEILDEIGISDAIPVFLLFVVGMLSAFSPVTAPSISLEGKTLWQIKTLPVRARRIFTAKELFAASLILPPAVLLAVCAAIGCRLPFLPALLLTVCAALFALFLSSAGLLLNLYMPNLNWKNETVPIKQGGAVAITLFGGWLLLAGVCVGAFFLTRLLPTAPVLGVLALLFAFGWGVCEYILTARGKEKFADL